MHIKIEKPVIESIINQAISFTEKKDNTQITSHFLIKADDKLTLKATDKEMGIEIQTQAEILEPGIITLNARKFTEIIKTLQNKEIEIKSEQDKVTIIQENSIYQLASFNPAEFPEFPDEKKEELKIDGEEFIKAIKKIFPAIDNNNPKQELNGALFDIKEKTNFVGTDSRRLALYSADAKGKESEIIVPKRAVSEIKRVFRNDMKILYDEVYLILKNENILFFTKLMNGKFPAYERIIPKEFKFIIKLDKKEFLNHLRQVSIISNEVKITITKDKIEFESMSKENMQAKTSYEINSDIDEFSFAINSKYLIDFLNVIDKDEFELCLNSPSTTIMVKEDKFITLIMPLSL